MLPKWRSFKDEPPYDWRTELDGHMESDPDAGLIAYVYKNSPSPQQVFFSTYVTPFKNGAFDSYRSHMVTSPYPNDRIEVIAWLPRQELEKFLETTFPGLNFGCSL